MRETCSDHSNVGDSTVILLLPATGGEGGEEGKQRQRQSVREFTSNLEQVTGSCLSRRRDALRKSMHLWTERWVKEVE